MTVASTGLPGKRLRQEEIDYMSSTIHPGYPARYYPSRLSCRLLSGCHADEH